MGRLAAAEDPRKVHADLRRGRLEGERGWGRSSSPLTGFVPVSKRSDSVHKDKDCPAGSHSQSSIPPIIPTDHHHIPRSRRQGGDPTVGTHPIPSDSQDDFQAESAGALGAISGKRSSVSSEALKANGTERPLYGGSVMQPDLAPGWGQNGPFKEVQDSNGLPHEGPNPPPTYPHEGPNPSSTLPPGPRPAEGLFVFGAVDMAASPSFSMGSGGMAQSSHPTKYPMPTFSGGPAGLGGSRMLSWKRRARAKQVVKKSDSSLLAKRNSSFTQVTDMEEQPWKKGIRGTVQEGSCSPISATTGA